MMNNLCFVTVLKAYGCVNKRFSYISTSKPGDLVILKTNSGLLPVLPQGLGLLYKAIYISVFTSFKFITWLRFICI